MTNLMVRADTGVIHLRGNLCGHFGCLPYEGETSLPSVDTYKAHFRAEPPARTHEERVEEAAEQLSLPFGVPERANREDDSQPLPTVNDEPSIQESVIADIEARKQIGIKRYGTPLQPFNGRDAMLDLYEELLDASIYAKQILVERDAAFASIKRGMEQAANGELVDGPSLYVFEPDELKPAVERYLDGKQTTLWGRGFDLIRPDSRDKAVAWLTETILQVLNGIEVEGSEEAS